MLGVTSDAGAIFEEEFRRQLKRTSWRIFTMLIPALLLIAAVVAPIVTELPGRTKSGSDYSSPPRQACSCSG